jgi:hypothetical protein
MGKVMTVKAVARVKKVRTEKKEKVRVKVATKVMARAKALVREKEKATSPERARVKAPVVSPKSLMITLDGVREIILLTRLRSNVSRKPSRKPLTRLTRLVAGERLGRILVRISWTV